tara:strand:+ start:481 stop:738 length:258 start_codon:yes stop_codon:yes gene_type:complete
MGEEMRNIIIFILGCITSYSLLYQGTAEVFELWEVAYDIGRKDGTDVAKAQYEWTDERLRQECVLMHFEADQKRREKLGLKGIGE